MSRRKVLITGTAGRLGSDLMNLFADRYEIVGFDHRESSPQDKSDQPRGIAVRVGSITDRKTVAATMEGVNAVVHCAAVPWSREPYEQVVEANVLGTFIVLEEAGLRKHVEQFIFISSFVWHGLNDSPREEHLPAYLPINEHHPTSATSPYAVSKVQGEQWCQAYVARFKKPVVAIRPSFIVRLVDEPSFSARPKNHAPHFNEYIGTSDLADLIIRALEYHPPTGFDVFLANAQDQCSSIPSLDLVKQFFAGIPVDRTFLEACEGYGAFVDCSRARETLGWQARYRCKR